MAAPLSLCLEDLNPTDPDRRYVRCVALVGRERGLGLSSDGAVLWQQTDPLACELWVSADDRLILYRPSGASTVSVHRAGRSVAVPFEKPVVLLAGDELRLGARRLLVHVHGNAPVVHAPENFVPPRPARRLAAVAAAVALAGSAAGCKNGGATKPDVEVRDQPPVVAPEPPPDAGSPPADAGADGATQSSDAATSTTATATASAAATAKATATTRQTTTKPIEVRTRPPAPPRDRDDPF